MFEAYCKTNLEEVEFGVFISRLSKPADIEQSLGYGTLGEKS
jgi:hypothetical protein